MQTIVKEETERTAKPMGNEAEMTPAEIKLAGKCRNCPLCRYGRNKPETIAGRVMNWHGKHCPAWQALIKLEQAEQTA